MKKVTDKKELDRACPTCGKQRAKGKRPSQLRVANMYRWSCPVCNLTTPWRDNRMALTEYWVEPKETEDD